MLDYLIYTDSTTDLTPEQVERMDVKIVPFEFTIGGKTYYSYPDWREMDCKTFYDRLREGQSAVTSLVNIERYLGIFEPELKAGNDILYICFSSGLTGSTACAYTACEELRERYLDRRIYVVDSLAASVGQGMLVQLAVQKRREGLSLDALADWVMQRRDVIKQWFTVDDLAHLRRGGRISSATAVVGGVLNIKPILRVNDEGKLVSADKARGRRAALEALLTRLQETGNTGDGAMAMISHSDCDEDAQWLAAEVRGRFGIQDVCVNLIGPVIGAHTGPGTVAIVFLESGR